MAAATVSASTPALTRAEGGKLVTLFLTGDVMTGRGVDQVLPHPVSPRIYERYAKSALDYVQLAERKNGRIRRPVPFEYIWGDALGELERRAPDARIVNLETAITTNDDHAPKGINYRMNPKNVRCLTALKVDCCVLGNNHVLDWGEAGCVETLDVLGEAGILTAGAGRTTAQATAPAVLQTKRGRVLVFSFGSTTSGIPRSWGATSTRPGINLVTDLCESTARTIGAQIRARRDRKDIVVASIHWGGNWGYEVPPGQRAFAHALIDEAGVDIVHGHSSHHPKGIELHHGKPVLYGCGDFINDYEGISGHGAYRGDLSLMYFVAMNRDTGRLERLEMVPMKMKRFRLHRATREDAEWLRDTLAREGQKLGTGVTLTNEGTLEIT